MATQEDTDNPNAGIWQKILSESTTAEGVSIEGRSVIVLGERNCGKTSLLSKLKKKDLHKDAKGLAIDYTYLDVKEDEDVLTRINVWQLEGEKEHNNLLKFALNGENIHKSVILITLDFSKPWDLVDTLETWLEEVTNLIKSLRLTSKVTEPLKNKLLRRFHNYKEPEEGAKKKKRVIDLTSTTEEDEEDVPTLDDLNALTKNTGIPIVVACCKTDMVSTLERNFHYRDDQFEYIQQHLRKICLEYGASLIYTSSREEYNCDVLFEYLEHLLFDFDFVYRTQVLAKEGLFIPIGWDSTEKINVDFRNQQLSSDPEQPFGEVITKPSSVLEQENLVPMVVPEDDQAFLERHKNAMDKQEHVKKKKEERDTSLQSPAASVASNPSTPTPDTQKEALKQNFLDQMKKAGTTSTPPSSNTPTSSPSKSIDRDEMKSFFNNLLKKP